MASVMTRNSAPCTTFFVVTMRSADSTPTNPMMENATSWALNVAITASRLLRLPARLDHGGAAGLPLGDAALGSPRPLPPQDPGERRPGEPGPHPLRPGAPPPG